MQDKFKFPTKNLSVEECVSEIKRLENLIDDRDLDLEKLQEELIETKEERDRLSLFWKNRSGVFV